jgi:predicted amidophosphoribosyltransferase
MPTPFMCHGCDKPTMNKSGVCDDCAEKKKKRSSR